MNLWLTSALGNFPLTCNNATSATFLGVNPLAFFIDNSVLPFMFSKRPTTNSPLARIAFSISDL